MIKVIKIPLAVTIDKTTKLSFQEMMSFLLRDAKWGQSLERLELRRSVRQKLEKANGELPLTIAEHELLDDVARNPTKPYNPEVADPAIDLIHAIVTAESRSES